MVASIGLYWPIYLACAGRRESSVPKDCEKIFFEKFQKKVLTNRLTYDILSTERGKENPKKPERQKK
jgi:hypothetical protein